MLILYKLWFSIKTNIGVIDERPSPIWREEGLRNWTRVWRIREYCVDYLLWFVKSYSNLVMAVGFAGVY